MKGHQQVQLSPINFFGIKAHFSGEAVVDRELKSKRRIEEVVMYRCPECLELHEWKDDAEDCCKEDVGKKVYGAASDCPVCGEEYTSHRDAADCCLWKDLDAPARWKVADAVEAGSDWATELGVATC